MSDNSNIIPMSANSDGATWRESVSVSPGISVGIEKLPDGTFTTFRRIGGQEDVIASPGLSAAASLLFVIYADFFASDAADAIDGEELSGALIEIAELSRELRAFETILREAQFASFDDALARLRRK